MVSFQQLELLLFSFFILLPYCKVGQLGLHLADCAGGVEPIGSVEVFALYCHIVILRRVVYNLGIHRNYRHSLFYLIEHIAARRIH